MSNQSVLDPKTHVGAVSLTVGDLARSLRFYRDVLGFADSRSDGASALLFAGDQPLLHLVELPGARPKPPRATGLYHFALLLPSRPDLARWLRHVLELNWPLQGWPITASVRPSTWPTLTATASRSTATGRAPSGR